MEVDVGGMVAFDDDQIGAIKFCFADVGSAFDSESFRFVGSGDTAG